MDLSNAFKRKILDNQVTIRDVLSHYLQANIEIGLINTAFQPLNVSALLELFPRELLIIPPLKTELLEESKTLQEVGIHESIFFKDSYGGEWILNRNNISTVCLIRIALQTDPIKLKILSQAYIMNEMTLNLVRENENPDEWDQLTLRELLELKTGLKIIRHFIHYRNRIRMLFVLILLKMLKLGLVCLNFQTK